MPNESKGNLKARNDRRRAYYARRALVARLDAGKPSIVPERMSIDQLWTTLERSLTQLLVFARDHSSVDMYNDARNAYECYAEIMLRGDQLKLFTE